MLSAIRPYITLMLIMLSIPATYPYTVALPTSETIPGAVLTATISAPADAAPVITADDLLTSAPAYLGGDTWKATITVPKAVQATDTPRTVRLIVNAQVVNSVSLRVNGGNRTFYLPLIRRALLIQFVQN